MTDKTKLYGFRSGQLGYIDSGGDVVPLRFFSFDHPLGWTAMSGFSASSIVWPSRSRFSRKVQHNIVRRETRAKRHG